MNNAAPTPAKLIAQQRRLADAIRGEHDDAGLRPGPGGTARVDVYRHAYRARLTEALRNNYPVLHRVLGDDAFAELAHQYLDAHPSARPSIRWFGDALARHLREAPSAVPHPSLIDLATMEWHLGLSFDSADAAVLAVDDLLTITADEWQALRFAAHPSVALLRLDWAVEPLWRAVTADPDAEAEPPEPSAHALLVWRQRLDTRWRSMTDDEAALLRCCLEGRTFAEWCEQAVAHAGDGAAAFAAGALRRWVDDGLLSRVERPGPRP